MRSKSDLINFLYAIDPVWESHNEERKIYLGTAPTDAFYPLGTDEVGVRIF